MNNLEEQANPYREIFENNLRRINDSKNTNDLIMLWFDQSVEQIVGNSLTPQPIKVDADILRAAKILKRELDRTINHGNANGLTEEELEFVEATLNKKH